MYLEPVTYSYQEIACLTGIITDIDKTKLIHKIKIDTLVPKTNSKERDKNPG